MGVISFAFRALRNYVKGATTGRGAGVRAVIRSITSSAVEEGYSESDVVDTVRRYAGEEVAQDTFDTIHEISEAKRKEEIVTNWAWNRPFDPTAMVESRWPESYRYKIRARYNIFDPETGTFDEKYIEMHTNDYWTKEQYLQHMDETVWDEFYEQGGVVTDKQVVSVIHKSGEPYQ